MVNIKLPPQLQEKWEQYAPLVKDHLGQLEEALGPAVKAANAFARRVMAQLAEAGGISGIGSKFRHVCVVGLNRSELLVQGESQSIFGDNWQDLVDDSFKRHLALVFFAPRGLDGQPVDPYLFLVGEGARETEEMADPATLTLAQQTVGPVPLLDFCRISPANPNTVNILVAADTLFHWDVKDNYVLPTTPTSWVRDVEQVLKTYPRTTKANIYTQWETDLLPVTERITLHKLRDLPLDPNTWLNQPTVQEKFGPHILTVAILLAMVVFGGLFYKGRYVDGLNENLQVVEQQIPRGGEFSDMEKAITEQEKMFAKRQLFALAVKDAARAIQLSGIQVSNFEVKVIDQTEAPRQYLVTVEAQPAAYQGWLQQDPIARSLLLKSALMQALRKPPTATGFRLEGLVDVDELLKQYRKLAPSPAAPKAGADKQGSEGVQ